MATMLDPKVHPPAGHALFARRLNRHRYHLATGKHKRADHANILCGEQDESSEHTMEYLLGHDAPKVCRDCLAKLGDAAYTAEVERISGLIEQKDREEAEKKARETERVRETLRGLITPGRIAELYARDVPLRDVITVCEGVAEFLTPLLANLTDANGLASRAHLTP